MGPQNLTKQSLPRGFFGVIFLAAFLMGISPAYGRIIVENFDNGDYNHNLFGVVTSRDTESARGHRGQSEAASRDLRTHYRRDICGRAGNALKLSINGQFRHPSRFQPGGLARQQRDGAGIVSQLFDVRRVAANGQPGSEDTYSFGLPGKGMTNVTTTDSSGKLRLKGPAAPCKLSIGVAAPGNPSGVLLPMQPWRRHRGVHRRLWWRVYGPTAADRDL